MFGFAADDGIRQTLQGIDHFRSLVDMFGRLLAARGVSTASIVHKWFFSFNEHQMLTVSRSSACQHDSTGNHLNLSYVLGCND